MPMIEIDENEYAGHKDVAALLELVNKDPEARAWAQKAIAKVAPERAAPEVKIRDEVATRFDEITTLLKADKEEREKEREERKAAEQVAKLNSAYSEGRGKLRAQGYNQDGIEAIEKLMEDRSIPDHEAAAALFDRMNPPPEPLMTGGNRWDWTAAEVKNAPDLKPLFEGNEEAFLGPAIQSALKEARGL